MPSERPVYVNPKIAEGAVRPTDSLAFMLLALPGPKKRIAANTSEAYVILPRAPNPKTLFNARQQAAHYQREHLREYRVVATPEELRVVCTLDYLPHNGHDASTEFEVKQTERGGLYRVAT